MHGLISLLLFGVVHVTGPEDLHAAVQEKLEQVEETAFEIGHRALKRTTRRFLLPSLEIGALYVPSVGSALAFTVFNATVRPDLPLQKFQDSFWEFNHWNEPTLSRWAEHMTSPPVFPDKDGYGVNYFIHPWVGATVHLLYRNHGASFLESFVLVVFWAVLWEYLAEAAYERPSLNDVFANAGGALMGEAMWRAKQLMLEHMVPGFWRNVAVTLIDPFGALETIVLDVGENHAGLGPVVRYLR